MNLIYLFLIFQQIAVLFNSVYAVQKVRGVAPEKQSLYDGQKPFSCLDGSAVIPFDQVNDDYCDCRDGSDEPGTSACMNGYFACENLGYIVQYIPSSRVNDGICDCCDGSDEYTNKIKCENKCLDLAAKMREEEEKLRLLREQGFNKRKELIQLGDDFKKSVQAKLQDLESQKTNLEAEKFKLEKIKNNAEALAKEARDKQDKIFEERRKEIEAAEILRKSKELFDLLDLNKDKFLTPDELLSHQELDILFDNDGSFTIEESKRLLDQNGNVAFEVFHSSYYEKISPHLNKPESTTHTPEQQTTADEHSSHDSEEHSNEEHDNEHEHDHEEHHEQHQEQQHSQPEKSVLENKYDEETQKLIDQSNEAKGVFEKSENELRNIENEIADLNKKLNFDVGPNAEFASMIDKCFEYEDREYIYKLCPFEKTVQKSKSNQGETTIGYWKSWSEDEKNKYAVMKFDNGLACWNGPSRSTVVHITCGIENKVTSVAEPNRCEYEMRFETPAVCDENVPQNASNQNENSHEEL